MIWDVPKLKYCPMTLLWPLLWPHTDPFNSILGISSNIATWSNNTSVIGFSTMLNNIMTLFGTSKHSDTQKSKTAPGGHLGFSYEHSIWSCNTSFSGFSGSLNTAVTPFSWLPVRSLPKEDITVSYYIHIYEPHIGIKTNLSKLDLKQTSPWLIVI